jgi:hypothetical protein
MDFLVRKNCIIDIKLSYETKNFNLPPSERKWTFVSKYASISLNFICKKI